LNRPRQLRLRLQIRRQCPHHFEAESFIAKMVADFVFTKKQNFQECVSQNALDKCCPSRKFFSPLFLGGIPHRAKLFNAT
jgi:hypothetical protein